MNEPEREWIIEVTAEASLVSPKMLPFEIGNALSALTKRRRLTKPEAMAAQVSANAIPMRLLSVDIQSSLQLAIDNEIYAYDAYFLECAKSKSYPLLTLDMPLRRLAKKLNIQVLE